MKEHPILFSTPMVQAIMEGRKTQTRRIVKPQPPSSKCEFIGAREFLASDKIGYYWSDGTHNNMQGFWPGIEKDLYCPYGHPGDVLWVRETFAPALGDVAYKADYSQSVLDEPRNKGIWKPSIHMPKAAARIWLEITEVKVERLQNISNEDVIAEGVKADIATDHPRGVHYTAFSDLWIKINGNGSWISNPWVWVVKFKILSTTGAASIQQPATSIQQQVNVTL